MEVLGMDLLRKSECYLTINCDVGIECGNGIKYSSLCRGFVYVVVLFG